MWPKFRRLIQYPLHQWPRLLFILGLTLTTSVITALQPWPLKILADYAFGKTSLPPFLHSVLKNFSVNITPATLVFTAALASLLLFILNSAINSGLSWGWTAAGQRMVYQLATDLFYRVQRLSLLFHKKNPVGDSLSRLTEDTYCVYTVTESLLVSPGQNILTSLTVGIVAWNLDPQLTLLMLLSAPFLAAASFFFGRKLKRKARQDREAKSRLMSFVHQTLSAIPVVQAFGKEESNIQKFQDLASDAVNISQRKTLLKSSHGLIGNFFTTLGLALILFFGGQRVLSGALSIGSLLIFIAYMRIIEKAFQGLIKSYGELKFQEASVDRVLEILDSEDIIIEAKETSRLPTLSQKEQGYVQLEEITFGYEEGNPILKEISFEAHPGEIIALVGETGVGKSTLVSLIPRFFDPWKGRVLLDGSDIRKLKILDLRSQVALLLQEPFLFPLSIAENIAYGRLNATQEEIQAAAVTARANNFIQKLPNGYDTVIGESGATLSGGEKQRLAIARALLKDAPILILDEPTSALDAHTEALLMEAVEQLMRRRTTFLIAHRLSTVRRANKIIVLKAGQIVETGTHDELLAEGGYYHRLHTLQFQSSFLEEAT